MDCNERNIFYSDMSRRAGEILRRFNRIIEGPLTRKRLLFYILIVVVLILYIGPGIYNLLFGSEGALTGERKICQNNFITPFKHNIAEYDAYMRLEGKAAQPTVSHNYVPYIGNGFIGLSLEHDSHLYLKHGRTLSLSLYFHPLYVINDSSMLESTIVEYTKGIVHRIQCGEAGLHASYQYYAHRTLSSLLVQEIHIESPSTSSTVKLSTPRISDWPSALTRTVKLSQENDKNVYKMTTGTILMPDSQKIIVVSVVYPETSNTIQISAGQIMDLTLFTTVQYSSPFDPSEIKRYKEAVEKKALEDIEKAISMSTDKESGRLETKKLKEKHTQVWQDLWYTGFYISDSKAEGIINGDRINATIYAVLSQARAYEYENFFNLAEKSKIMKALTYSEGCFEGYSTLDAFNLWKPLNTIQNLNEVTSIWYLTLEKLGCHNLLKAGASGVNQAMILSFGSLRFSNQHLEYNIHPSKLHRDFLFRRINYGNMTHVNISVILQEDNKAALFVALDRSDKSYYACDAGCLDSPVPLGPYRKYFPVKLTEPLTAILYITADKQHIEDLRHAIHVKEVAEAPAHEDHIIALHKHGNSLGGLNPLFWISIIAVIVFFHLFLCRLIMNEFCDNGVSYRRLNNRP